MSAVELREYLDSLNNKNIDQLMGAVSQGSLIQGLILATLATTVLLLACTLIPYVWESKLGAAHVPGPAAEPASAAAEAPATAAGNPAAGNPSATAAAASGTPKAGAAEPAAPGQPAVSKKVLGGVDEVKQSDPSVNPLDSKIDDLFDKTR
jgi:hypothetical protein